jgi:small subunit ribosomal protein S16
MLAIRMQRTGRKKHAMYRVVVQNSRVTPTSGKVIALLGSYDPHTKVSTLQKEKASFYLEHGAQPSGRVAMLLQKEGVKLPKWVVVATKKEGTIRHTDKLRRNQPAAPVEEVVVEAPAAEEPEAPAEEPVVEETAPVETETEAEPAAEELAADAPTEEKS